MLVSPLVGNYMQLQLPLFTGPNHDKGELEWLFDLIDKYHDTNNKQSLCPPQENLRQN